VPGIGGLSIANNLLANDVALNLDRNETTLQKQVTRLSSGLRITTAADDPSGLAIAQRLQSQVTGFDQGTRNVQDANNATTVASGALLTIKSILQRARVLAVEASSDLTSVSDRQSLQVEIDQLLLEINRIADDTTFNGIQLLQGGQLVALPAGTVQPIVTQNATQSVTSNSITLSLPSAPQAGDVLVAGVNYYAPGNPPTAPPGWTLVDNVVSVFDGNGGSQNGGYATYIHVVQASDPTSYTWTFPQVNAISGSILEVTNVDTSNPIDAHAAQAQGGPAATATTPSVTATSTNDLAIAFTGIDWPSGVTTATTTPGFTELSYQPNIFHQILTQTDSNVTAGVPISAGTVWNAAGASVGGAIILLKPLVVPGQTLSMPLVVHDGPVEGAQVGLSLPLVNTAMLGISDMDVTSVLNAETAIGGSDVAIDRITTIMAQMGAQTVSLGEDEDNNNIASVDLASSASAISDLNVPQASTDFTRTQITVQIGSSVLAQANTNAQSVLALFR